MDDPGVKVSTSSTSTEDGTEPAAVFPAELAHWREVRGKSKKALATAMGFDPSYVSHVEAGRHPPTEAFASRAEKVLDAGGALWAAFTADESGSGRRTTEQAVAFPEPAALLVERDEAELRYEAGLYRLSMRRTLRNTGAEPVTRYLVRISVDRWPGDPQRSNALYRSDPLTWDELGLTALCSGEPMTWTVKHDRDAFKEVWLAFANSTARFPLYPGERTVIEYSYTVPDTKWGNWFQRAIRLPTGYLAVALVFPTALGPVVWGTQSSMTADAFPLRTAIGRDDDMETGTSTFIWSAHDPQLDARYRLEWTFRHVGTGGRP